MDGAGGFHGGCSRLTSRQVREGFQLYLRETGLDVIDRRQFVEWLRDRPDHPFWPAVWGLATEEAALRHRMAIVGSLLSRARVSCTVRDMTPEARPAMVRTRVVAAEAPAFISDPARRPVGGGYQAFDASNPAHVAALQREAAQSLLAWIRRYALAASAAGVRVDGIERAAHELRQASEPGEAAGAA